MQFFKFLAIGAYLLFFLSGCASFKKPLETQQERAMSGFDLIVVPDKEDEDGGNWFVSATLDDRSYRFYLDTGAGSTSMVWDNYTSQFKSTGVRQTSGALAKHSNDMILIPQIRVGAISKSNLIVSRAPKESKGKNNLLGMNFLKTHAFHFIFEKKRVEIFDPSASKVDFKFHELVLGERYHPYVGLTYKDGIEATGVWDTGAGMTVFDIAFVKKHPHLFKKIGVSTGTDSSGTSLETPMYLMESFELGGFLFPASKVAVVDLSVPNSTIQTPMEFILGYNVLSKANWIFDFPNKKWAISKMLQ